MDYEGKQVMIILYPFLLEVESQQAIMPPSKLLYGQKGHWHFVGSPFCRFHRLPLLVLTL